MPEKLDLRDFMDAWPYDPDDNVRLVSCADGREVIQVRQPLGIEQYELNGRPDGARPHGMESALEYQLARLERARGAGREDEFRLSEADCEELFGEGLLYYYRYFYLFQLEDWERTVRDTARNLRVFDLVNRHAEREDDRVYLEQWRPYIVRINAVARVMIEMNARRHERARDLLQRAIRLIEQLPELDNETFRFERQRSLTTLEQLAAEIEEARPLGEREKLQRELQQAVAAEEFERAAQLRDRLRSLSSRPAPGEAA
jgi:hypothetical protein